MGFARPDGRGPEELRPVNIIREFNKWAEGSVLYQAGDTKVVCTATVEDRVPSFLRGTGSGWVTAEYSMLPRATETRSVREAARGRVGGRTYEIQRLVGRALRSIVDLRSLGERTIWLDCDVIQADGGTRTASITGAFVALVDALYRMAGQENWEVFPVADFVAAVSAGVVDGCSLLDLCYVEDSQADVDMNFVMTGSGRFIEVQGTAESSPFGRDQLDRLLFLAEQGIRQLVDVQKSVLPETAVQAIMRAQSMQTSEERN